MVCSIAYNQLHLYIISVVHNSQTSAHNLNHDMRNCASISTPRCAGGGRMNLLTCLKHGNLLSFRIPHKRK
jgi:hypothetical protein